MGAALWVLSIMLIVFNAPYMSISSSWCSFSESLLHMFMCYSFASWFWHVILDAFDWSLASSNNIFYILASLIAVHPLYGNKKSLFGRPFCALLLDIWSEHNRCFFNDSLPSLIALWIWLCLLGCCKTNNSWNLWIMQILVW